MDEKQRVCMALEKGEKEKNMPVFLLPLRVYEYLNLSFYLPWRGGGAGAPLVHPGGSEPRSWPTPPAALSSSRRSRSSRARATRRICFDHQVTSKHPPEMEGQEHEQEAKDKEEMDFSSSLLWKLQ